MKTSMWRKPWLSSRFLACLLMMGGCSDDPKPAQRPASAKQLVSQYLAAVANDDVDAFNLLFVNDAWMTEVCPGSGSRRRRGRRAEHIADWFIAAKKRWASIGPCEVVFIDIGPLRDRSARGHCEGRYQEVDEIEVRLLCADNERHQLVLDDVAVVGAVWAVRDEIKGEFAHE